MLVLLVITQSGNESDTIDTGRKTRSRGCKRTRHTSKSAASCSSNGNAMSSAAAATSNRKRRAVAGISFTVGSDVTVQAGHSILLSAIIVQVYTRGHILSHVSIYYRISVIDMYKLHAVISRW
jgi:hypothetical protein